jgi:hypothetical protein
MRGFTSASFSALRSAVPALVGVGAGWGAMSEVKTDAIWDAVTGAVRAEAFMVFSQITERFYYPPG